MKGPASTFKTTMPAISDPVFTIDSFRELHQYLEAVTERLQASTRGDRVEESEQLNHYSATATHHAFQIGQLFPFNAAPNSSSQIQLWREVEFYWSQSDYYRKICPTDSPASTVRKVARDLMETILFQVGEELQAIADKTKGAAEKSNIHVLAEKFRSLLRQNQSANSYGARHGY